ncbi:MAG: CAP domain-containing protein [Bacteroidota bacterium]
MKKSILYFNSLMLVMGWISANSVQAQEESLSSWDDRYGQYNWQSFKELEEAHDTLEFDRLDLGLLNAAVFFVSNDVRVQAGKSPLRFSVRLRNMADLHTRAMAKHAFVSHYNWRNWRISTPDRRNKLFQANAGAENVASAFLYAYRADEKYIIKRREGVAYFHRDDTHEEILRHTYLSFAQELVRRWMGSPGHRENLLHDRLRRLGCSIRVGEGELEKDEIPLAYCTQEFGW